jgi:hypothetical protein
MIIYPQLFIENFRTDLSLSTAFALQTLDGGSNPQSSNEAGIEAVRLALAVVLYASHGMI